jgi:type I restriction enzyme M protein
LKKHDVETTENIRKTKRDLQDQLSNKTDLFKKVREWEKEKSELIKKGDTVCLQIDANLKLALLKLAEENKLTADIKKQKESEAKDQRKLYEKSEEYADWKKAINEEYSEKLNGFKEDLEEQYSQQKQARLLNYPIFMAIAEYIGYDATGKTIQQNDLPEITEELRRFIDAIEKGQDANFL